MPSAVQMMPMWQAYTMRDTGIAFIALAGVAVSLRFVAKSATRISLGADDWWILGAYALFLIEQLMQLYSIVALINWNDVTDFLKYMYISAFFYYAVHTALRIGIICYLRRIFTTPQFRRLSMVIIVLSVLWCIPGTVVEIVTCTPMQTDWDPLVKGTCLDYMLFYIIVMTFDLFLDALIIVLPLREIAKLQMPLRRKLGVSLIFLVGAFVLITGIIRIVIVYDTSPKTLNVFSDVTFYNMNDGAAFLGACMPSYLPLVIKVRDYGSTLWSKWSSKADSELSGDTKQRYKQWGTGPTERRSSWYKQTQGSDSYALTSNTDNSGH